MYYFNIILAWIFKKSNKDDIYTRHRVMLQWFLCHLHRKKRENSRKWAAAAAFGSCVLIDVRGRLWCGKVSFKETISLQMSPWIWLVTTDVKWLRSHERERGRTFLNVLMPLHHDHEQKQGSVHTMDQLITQRYCTYVDLRRSNATILSVYQFPSLVYF